MQQTTNYSFKKIDLTDSPPDITVINSNWDTIDQYLKEANDTADAAIPKSIATAADQVIVSNGTNSWAAKTLAQFKTWLSLSTSDISNFAANVRTTVLTGLSTSTNAVISATDNILGALGKLQKQISDNLTALDSHKNAANPHSGSVATDGSKVMTGALVMSNNVSVKGKDTGAVLRDMMYVSADDKVYSGSNALPFRIVSSDVPQINGQEIYYVGHKPTIFEIAGEGVDFCGIDPNNVGKIYPYRNSAPIRAYSANMTLDLACRGAQLFMTGSAAMIVTIPTNAAAALDIGTEIEICRWGSGSVTISPSSGVTIYCSESARTISATAGVVALKKIEPDVWLLTGNLG
jgi:hypothetical protein